MSEMIERVMRAIHAAAFQYSLPREGIRTATFEEVRNCPEAWKTLEAQARAAIVAMLAEK